MSGELHPAEKNLRNKCREYDLNESQTDILLNLFGWANRDPKSGLTEYQMCILPQMRMRANYLSNRQNCDKKAKDIGKLLLHLIGFHLEASLRDDPIGLLVGDLHMGRHLAVWVIIQLGLWETPPLGDSDLDLIAYYAPEIMPNEVVLPAIAFLLDRKQGVKS